MLHRRKAEKQRITITHLLGKTSHHGEDIDVTSSSTSSPISKARATFLCRERSWYLLEGSGTCFSDFTSAQTFPACLRRERKWDGNGEGEWLVLERDCGEEEGEGGEKEKSRALLLIVLFLLLLPQVAVTLTAWRFLFLSDIYLQWLSF